MRSLQLHLLCVAALAVLAPRRALAADAPKSEKGDKTEAGGSEEEEKAKATNKIPSLADHIKPVSGAIFEGAGRHELTPELDISLNDPFFQKYMFGLKYAYHINNQFSIGVRGVFGFATPSSSVNVCSPTLGCNTPTLQQLTPTPGNIGLIVGLDVAWAPLYGKMNFFGEKVVHFDTFAVAGFDGIQYHDPSSTPAGATVFAPGGHVGIGQHYLFNSWFGIRADLRDYIYPGRRDVNGTAQSGIENQLMLELGASFFFPLHPKSDS